MEIPGTAMIGNARMHLEKAVYRTASLAAIGERPASSPSSDFKITPFCLSALLIQ